MTVSSLPDERVTRSIVRLVDHPSGVRFALITLDNGLDHTKPNTLGPGGLASLAAALDQADAMDVDAVAITGKPFWFLAGADLAMLAGATDLDQARRGVDAGHAIFRRLGDGPRPTFAFVNGAVMGGGVELALHCSYRTISTGVTALALPECFLGLIPAWGGTWLLPHLIGPDAAVTVIVENPLSQNRMLKGQQAYGLGIADAIFAPADFLESSLRWAADVVRGSVVVDRPEPDTGAAWDQAVARGRAIVTARTRDAAIGPARALDLIDQARYRSRDEGFTAEAAIGAELFLSDQLRAGLYAFDLVQRRAKRPVDAPSTALARPVTSVGVVGAGLMASQLALLMAQRLEVPVLVTDVDQERLDRGLGYIHGEIETLLAKGRINRDRAHRLRALFTGTLDLADFADTDFVIEAVFEELALKQQVFGDLEKVVRPDAVLATNTSSLSVTAMTQGLAHPERVLGFHFFNPVAVMPLLEIARTDRTDDASYATAFAVGKALKKTCIAVRDAPGFVVNRLFIRMFNEVTRAVDEGTPYDVADHALDPLGLPMTPLQLIGFTGPAVTDHVMTSLHDAFPDRFITSANLARMVEARLPGYHLADGSLDPRVTSLYAVGDAPSTADEILRRAVEAMADEVRRLLDEGVVREPQEVDLALITGGGYPFHLGGITPYLDRTGVSERVTGRRFLPEGVANGPRMSG
ncbi:3-hydroxyacyl-CoA dehydrogenase NAD-binding domain-containing protein [Acidothermaceae bacterium B102]|nr:3-hydroxyacyl-CoA dehydrogenase NAD-binding domain-containing protein [Acidothermaceae bacterium B102]